ncbi:hypothetical protein [Ralstonia pseudosolanacearum]|uniref:hypothetical protein n=1 Tax=Ralstonia pseudosolanacearum TaxID=1310165 RepID=UPI003F78C102
MQQRLFTALSVWTVARKRQLAAWRGGFMQQRQIPRTTLTESNFANDRGNVISIGAIDKVAVGLTALNAIEELKNRLFWRCCINRI